MYPMKIALFGSTGFIGQAIMEFGLKRGHHFRILTRGGNPGVSEFAENISCSFGSIDDPEAVESVIQGCDAVIYSVGLIREFPKKNILFSTTHVDGVKHSVKAAEKFGVKRFILISAHGIESAKTAYQVSKRRGEDIVRNSALHWTIIRPSMVFGNPRGKMEIATQLYQQIVKPWIPAPLFFEGWHINKAGKMLFTPVHSLDVATTIIEMLENIFAKNGVVKIGGPESLTWGQIIRRIGEATGKKKLSLPVPTWSIGWLVSWLGKYQWFPVSKDQLVMLMEGSQIIGSDRVTGKIRFDIENLRYLKIKYG